MKVAVVGNGTMGNGIAQTFAVAGHDVIIKGRSDASLSAASILPFSTIFARLFSIEA